MAEAVEPVVVVTGASRGIGRCIALTLASHGFRVFAGVRREPDGTALERDGEGRIVPVPLEVTDPVSIHAAVGRVTTDAGPRGLAGLVNNAGIAVMGPTEQVPVSTVEEIFRVNVYGTIAVTQAFLPLLRKGRGRLVNVSSGNGKIAFPFTGAYCGSKFALEGFSDTLRLELAPWGIHVIVIEPGAFDTTMRAEGLRSWTEARRSLAADALELYDGAHRRFSTMIAGMNQSAPPVQPVADTVLEALTTEEPATRYPVGEDMKQLGPVLTMSDRERDAVLLGMMGQ